MATTIGYRSYAKLNLYLDVLDRRTDGYHNIETIFQSVSLADELYVTEDSSRLSLVCSTSELDTESNLVYQAALLLRERTGCSLGAEMRLEKNIPIAAGMAGGSGNAAAALVALNDLWNLHLRREQLLELALELGSDVPFCMQGGTVIATGRGEKMEPLSSSLPETWFVLLHPPVAVSASRIYNSPRLTHSAEQPVEGRTPSFNKAIDLLARGEFSRLVFNRMETPVFATHPNLAEAKQWLLEQGCVAAAMSGSGPTLFGVCTSRKQALVISGAFHEYKSTIAGTVPTGLERIQ